MKQLFLFFIVLCAALPSECLGANPFDKYREVIERRRFTIFLTEMFSMKMHSKVINDCYISVDGDKAVLRVDPRISDLYTYVIDHQSYVRKVPNKRGKHDIFLIKLSGDLSWLKYKARVTVYESSNKCFVQILQLETNSKVCSFRGHIEL